MINIDAKAPFPLRVARAITITQTVAASVVAVIGLVVLVTSTRSDDVASRAGHPNEFAGLAAGIGAFFALVFGAVALASGAAAIGLCRNRTWGLVTAGVTQIVMLLVVARPAVSGMSPLVWLLVIAPAVAVLASVLDPKSRAWCRARALA